jgi:cytochrome c biogenesis protein CcmG/thiol:disulfide interchange protein DsbE
MNRRLLSRIAVVGLIGIVSIAWAMQEQGREPSASSPQAQAPVPQPPERRIDPKAEQILRDFAAFYQQFRQGTVKARSAMSASQGGQEMTLDVDFDFASRRPNQFALRARKASFNGADAPVATYNGDAVCDGEHLYLLAPMLNSFIEKDAPRSFEDLLEGDAEMAFLSASGGTELQILIGLLSDDPYGQLTETATELRYVGEETVNERTVHHICVTSEQMDVHLWMHAGEEPWLLRVKPDLEKFFTQMAAEAGEELTEKAPALSFEYWDWSKESPAEDAFAFTAPAGAEKTDTFFQEMQAPAQDAALALVGRTAPTFELQLLNGGTFNPADSLGKDILILDFWATWCAPCRKALPVLAKVAEAYKDKGVLFCAVDVAEPEDRVRPFVEKLGYTFNIALDREAKVADMFRVNGIPQTVIVDKNGVIQAVHIGLLPDLEQRLTTELDTLLRGENLFGGPAETAPHETGAEGEGEA